MAAKLRHGYVFAILVSVGVVAAQAASPSRDVESKIRADSAEYLAKCMADWDAATHMTRQEWARTCRRVVDNRAKFMREQGPMILQSKR